MSTTIRHTADLMTAEEFYEFVHRPENEDRHFELDEGKVIELPPPQIPHGFYSQNIGALLWIFARQRKRGYVCSNDSGVVIGHDPDTVRGPDVMFFDDGKSAKEIAQTGYSDDPPVLAVEVLSPSDRPGRVARKVDQYLRAGVKLVWSVDPEVPEITVYRPNARPELLGSNDTLHGGAELPGFECRVAEFFELPGGAPAE
ncbi:MAG: Uma2 family endonuclease [Planctomycetota bacterium]|nr:Uma2 family endonuclease [Planctomycetaceae bacterium]MDQ3329547.1 Uma2 family endonuclease [Planctomycetota bacterium]